MPHSPTKQNPWRAVLGGTKPVCTGFDMLDDAQAVMNAVGWQSAHVMGSFAKFRKLKAAARRIPGATFVSFPGMRHKLPEELWSDFVKHISGTAHRA